MATNSYLNPKIRISNILKVRYLLHLVEFLQISVMLLEKTEIPRNRKTIGNDGQGGILRFH